MAFRAASGDLSAAQRAPGRATGTRGPLGDQITSRMDFAAESDPSPPSPVAGRTKGSLGPRSKIAAGQVAGPTRISNIIPQQHLVVGPSGFPRSPRIRRPDE